MNDSLQKLPGWLSDDLRSLIYKHGLEDKVMEFDKSFAREHILEALQELLPQDEMVLRNQAVTLPNQSIHSRSAHSEKIISREGVAKQSGNAETVLLSQALPLALAIPIITYVNIFHNYLITYCNYIVCSQEKNMEFVEKK